MVNPSIFKSYDVRGIYPTELDYEAAFQVGRAFVKKTGVKTVVVGHDARLSAPELQKGLLEGLSAEGAQVYGIGMVPTEGLYFAVANYPVDGGVMITASHNPKEYNGLKMLVKRDGMIQMVRGKDLLDMVDESNLPEHIEYEPKRQDIWADFSKHIFSFADTTSLIPLKVVIDASNGVMGQVVEKIQDKLPIEIIPLNFEPDGNFPNHSPNPLEKGSSDVISKKVVAEKADFGIMFDGDGDRIFLMDETGKLVSGDVTLLLLAKHFLQKNPGMGIAYNAICSKAVPEFVKKWGGVPVRTQVGFVNVREGLIQNNGIMGGELSCHYCFKDNWYMDSGMIAFFTLLQIISQDGRKISEITRELSPYYKSAEDNFKVTDKEAILEKVKEKFTDGAQDFLDGVTVSYKDWWFNLRPSNTEPLLRLTIEANSQDLLKQKHQELASLVK